MLTKDVIDYIKAEQNEDLVELNYLDLLAPEALEAKGYCLLNAKLKNSVKEKGFLQVDFSLERNYSRLRPGDEVVVYGSGKSYQGIVIENQVDEISIRMGIRCNLTSKTLWNIKLNDFFPSTNVISALTRLVPGYPGWHHFGILSGETVNLLKKEKLTLSKDIISQFNLNEAQTVVITESLRLRPLYAIQGPPGCSKTYILAITAEILSRAGLRVTVMAPTHQAVNNALNRIKTLFSEREVIKIGGELKSHGLENINSSSFSDFNDAFSIRTIKDPNPIIGLTYYSGIYNLINRNNYFCPNVLLIDEAGQLNLSLGYLVGMFGAGSVILYGDDMQMPPIINSELKNHHLSTSLFKRVKDLRPDMWGRLEITYRLNQELSDFIGSMFYIDKIKGKTFLKPDESVKDRSLVINGLASESRLIQTIFSTPKALFWIEQHGKYCKQYNNIEAEQVVEIISFCLKHNINKDDIAVVTPFRKQAAEIRRHLLKEFLSSELPIVDTVERVQGLTVEVIIVSLVASDPDYIESAADFLYSVNRINVAISRAKTKVIILCSKEMLEANPHTHQAFIGRNVLKEIKRRSKVILS